MAEMHFGNSDALTSVIYNGTDLDYVYYNNTLVFEKRKQITEQNVSFEYYATSASSSTSFSYPSSQTIRLQYTPKKIISISGGMGPNPGWTISSDGTSGSYSTLVTINSGTYSYISLNWSITDGGILLKGTGSTYGSRTTYPNVTVTYEY